MGQPPDSDYIRVGKIAVQRGLMSREQLEKTIHELSDVAYARMREGADQVPELGEFLVQKGFLTAETLREIQREMERMIVEPVSKKFGKYTLLREIGRGGMSVVWEAFDNELRRRVAVKFLTSYRPGKAEEEDDETLERFYREAQTAAKLKHPNIIDIYEVSVREGMHYIAMEFIEGTTFGEAIAGRKMELRACVALLRDVTRAIQHAHENGIIHRDVKPQNVMIDATGRAVVMDFGLARHVKESRRLTLSGIAIGTPSYMSPEHAQGSKGELDPRSDVYSLGAILFEILTGRPPFIGESPMQIMLATVQDDAPAPRSLNPDAPADLEAICLKAIEKEKERRYATAGEFADELERWLGGERVRARPPSPTARWVRKVGPGRGTALLAGAIVLVVAAAVVFSWERRVERRLEVSARLRVAAVLEEAERFEHARSEYSAALALDPANASARDGIDRCGRESERRSRARRHFDAAMLRFSAGEDAPAIEEFDAALRAFDRFGVAYHYRALAHERAGRTEEAAKDMERAAKAEPGNPVYRFELERLRKKAGR